jgi:hypothetical protein
MAIPRAATQEMMRTPWATESLVKRSPIQPKGLFTADAWVAASARVGRKLRSDRADTGDLRGGDTLITSEAGGSSIIIQGEAGGKRRGSGIALKGDLEWLWSRMRGVAGGFSCKFCRLKGR